jgi:hypothetical protein
VDVDGRSVASQVRVELVAQDTKIQHLKFDPGTKTTRGQQALSG